RLTNLNAITVPTESEPEVAPQPAPQTPGLGVAAATDTFETANTTANSYANLVEQQQNATPASLPVLSNDPTVDASSMFDFVAEAQEPAAPAPPAPPESGLGQTLEDFTEKKITDTY